MSLLIPADATLMEWREPNAYTRKDLSHGGWIGLVIVLMIPTVLLGISAINHNFSRREIILALIFLIIGIAIFLREWFGPGNWVCLEEDCVSRARSRPPRRTRYQNIKSCIVSHESYDSIKFSALKFTLKIGLPAGQVEKIVLPEDVNLDRVLHILRDKGVKIVEEPLQA